jgi:hypothetical protein
MDLRRRTTQALAGAGAFLVVAGLSLGGGVALAEPGASPEGAPPHVAKATTSTSDQGQSAKSNDKNDKKKDRSKRRSTTTTAGDSSGTGSTDSTGPNRSTSPTATTTPTTTPPPTTPTTTATPGTTRPTPSTTTPPTTAGRSSDSSDPPDGLNGGTYNGGSYQGAQVDPDEGTTTTTAPSNRTPGPQSGSRPSSRSGSGLPPGIYPVGPGGGADGSGTGDSDGTSSERPSRAGAPAPIAVVPGPSTPVSTAESPNEPTPAPTSAAGSAGTANPAPAFDPDSEVRNGNQTTSESPAPARRSRQLSQTGDGTRRLILFGGVALLLGAMVVAFTGRDGPILAAAAALPVGPGRRRPRARKELFGWEEGVPLAPAKRELARSRLGLSADRYDSYFDDEL